MTKFPCKIWWDFDNFIEVRESKKVGIVELYKGQRSAICSKEVIYMGKVEVHKSIIGELIIALNELKF
jgi:hypothetical protein